MSRNQNKIRLLIVCNNILRKKLYIYVFLSVFYLFKWNIFFNYLKLVITV